MHKKRVIFRHLKAFVSDARAVNKKCQKRLCVVGYTGVVNILSLLFYPFRSVHWAQTFSRYHNVLSHLKNLNFSVSRKGLMLWLFFSQVRPYFKRTEKSVFGTLNLWKIFNEEINSKIILLFQAEVKVYKGFRMMWRCLYLLSSYQNKIPGEAV